MKYIFANWKSNKNRKDAELWMNEFDKHQAHFSANEDLKIVIIPSMPLLMFISNRLLDRKKHPQVYLGVQDISPYPAGSYTGAVSTHNLDGFNVKYSLLGHSERRHYFGESDQIVANKVELALEAEITPVICVDEGYIETQANLIDKKLREQCIIAYEPISAIGTGDEMGQAKVKEVVERIKKAFGNVEVIYGGSVDGDNINEYLEVCDGVLVGGACLKVEEFKRLV